MKQKGSGLPEVKRLNRVHIKQIIYQRAPVTRAEIAQRLGLTLPTITTSVADMLAEGVLCERPADGWETGPQGGRKPMALDFVPGAAYALGAELGPHSTTAVLLDVRGGIAARSEEGPAPEAYEDMLDALDAQFRALMRVAPGDKILGVGVGLPGFIEADRGVVRSSPRTAWHGRALATDLSARLGLCAVIDNNVRMRAGAEELFPSAPRPDVFAYYFISRGIACPLMMKTGIWSGYTAGAGEIGHTIVLPGGPRCPRCGHRGCLSAVASEGAILGKCRAACLDGSAPILRGLCSGGPPRMEDVLRAQALGDGTVSAILAEAVRFLGITLANTVNLISPGLVLVEGALMESPQNKRLLRETAFHYLYGLNSEEVRIEFLPFDSLRGARGAAARVIKQYWIEC